MYLVKVKAIQEKCQVKGVKVLLLLHFKTKNSPFLYCYYLSEGSSILNNIFKTKMF